MILKRSSISRNSINPGSEEMAAPWKSIRMDRLKSGRIASVWLSPQLRILEAAKMPIYFPGSDDGSDPDVIILSGQPIPIAKILCTLAS
jgi:hypothetical protein